MAASYLLGRRGVSVNCGYPIESSPSTRAGVSSL
jgi:hypothetical protein